VIASAGVRDLAEQISKLVPDIEYWFAFGGTVAGYQEYAALLASDIPRLADQPRGSEMLYSSGTTGRPKGIKPRLLPIQVDEPGDPLIALLGQVFKI
jgi:long-chain acyl-CoA synthetase